MKKVGKKKKLAIRFVNSTIDKARKDTPIERNERFL